MAILKWLGILPAAFGVVMLFWALMWTALVFVFWGLGSLAVGAVIWRVFDGEWPLMPTKADT
jgi:hypothetical protein